ncbi:MAG: hypothetical protein AAF721_06860 [Myxococcota bacterium]
MTERPSETERLRALFRDEAWTADRDAQVDAGALIRGELDQDDAVALAARALDEPDVAFAVRVAAAMDEARREASAEVHGARPSSRPAWPWAVGLAVAAALLLFVFTRPPSLPELDDSTIRSGPVRAIEPTKPAAVLSRDAFVLEWSGGPPDATYDVFVTTAELQPVFQARELTERTLQVPATKLEAYPAGSKLLWRVVAVTREGRRVHSTAFEVEVK